VTGPPPEEFAASTRRGLGVDVVEIERNEHMVQFVNPKAPESVIVLVRGESMCKFYLDYTQN